MTENLVAKALLTPFSLLYGFGVSTRNLLYDSEVIKSTNFSVPVISVGNLSIGGAGKTPHIEHLIGALNPYINLATLSRGYNRSTKGFRFVKAHDNARFVGDEPLMYARKHREVVVAVGESRATAIPAIMGRHPEIQTILLDDAFQHRSVSPYINILLTQYEKPFTRDFLLPAGRLREWRSSYERADIIIVTKCPDTISEDEKRQLIAEINPNKNQEIYFTKYTYYNPYSFYNPRMRLTLADDMDIVLLSAIANTSYLVKYLDENVASFTRLEYEDHHNYTERDIEYIAQVFKQRDTTKKLVLTTEKDAMRLDIHRNKLYEHQVPVYILPLKVQFLFNEENQFLETIKQRLLHFKV